MANFEDENEDENENENENEDEGRRTRNPAHAGEISGFHP